DIEQAVLGHRRSDVEIGWLLARRQGHLYRRGGQYVGFSFVGRDGAGPMAALDPGDLPDILVYIEELAHSSGLVRLELQLPAPNEVGIRHMLARGFRIDRWINI